MSTDYKILKLKGWRSIDDGDGFGLVVTEGSGRFDLDFHIREGSFAIADGLDVEELCEAGLRFLQVALYNCADAELLRAWLRVRVGEVDFSSTRTPFPE